MAFGWPSTSLIDRQLDELLVGAGRRMAQRADAFGDQVERVPLLGVLRHEHQVQAVELRPGDVPVEVVRHQVERVAVGQQAGEALAMAARSLSEMPMSSLATWWFFHDVSPMWIEMTSECEKLPACGSGGLTQINNCGGPRTAPDCGSGGRRRESDALAPSPMAMMICL
jgi:hypothetical protein